MCNVVPTSHEKKTNTVCIYVFAMTQINALQCGETIANEEHVREFKVEVIEKASKPEAGTVDMSQHSNIPLHQFV
jgi:hypothetical protein